MSTITVLWRLFLRRQTLAFHEGIYGRYVSVFYTKPIGFYRLQSLSTIEIQIQSASLNRNELLKF